MIYELRRYELFNHNKKAFHDRFEQHVLKFFDQYGFQLIGAWDTEIGDGPEFTYVLAWPDLNTRQAAWDKYNSDEEWGQVKKDSQAAHGQLVAKTHSKIIKPTKYSPLK
jgi:heme-degrading monooxygenase HmoA